MNTSLHLSVDEASRLAVTATSDDLEGWARSVAVNGQVELAELVDALDLLRAASTPQQATSSFPMLAAS
jgi:hypothetical protein